MQHVLMKQLTRASIRRPQSAAMGRVDESATGSLNFGHS
jgi:hypothetical protein